MTLIKYISEKDFTNNKLQEKGLALIECYNNTSGPLLIMEPILCKLRKKFKQNVVHFRINTDKNPSVIKQFYVINEHTYIIFYDGKLIDRIDGILPFSEFANLLDRHLKQQKL